MYWASRRPTPWMRSVVPIVCMTHGEVAAQSPSRGCAPPTTTTDRAPGRRSPGRCFAGACASKAAASAMPQTVAPDLRATDFSCLAAPDGKSAITVARAVSPEQPRVAREPFSLLQLPVLASHGADAHALEALRDRVAEEAERLDALREEVAVDHRPPPRGIVLVHDLQEPLLERADAVGLRARVALLAVVGRGLDAPVLHRSGQARRADAQARRRPDALVHRRAARMWARRLGQG